MPEGDTLYRTAMVLREVLAGRQVEGARGRPGGAQLERVVGSRVNSVDAQGKHLLIRFDNGLTLHTHLRMNGSWHRYRPGEPWKRSASRAVAVLEVADAVAVCFDAPVVELMETRAETIHPTLQALGPDLLAEEPDLDEVVRRLSDPTTNATPIGEALLDQRRLAGLGNVYRSEVLFLERISPFVPVRELSDEQVRALVLTGERLLRANVGGPARVTVPGPLGEVGNTGAGARARRRGRLWVYGRAGRPCQRCGTRIRTRVFGELPRRVFWCPSCQPES